MKRSLCLLVWLGTLSVSAQTLFPGTIGTALRDSLRSHYMPSLVLNYDQARDTLFAKLQRPQDDSLTGVYTGVTIYLDPTKDPTTEAFGLGFSTEHTWPQSKGATEGTNAHSDLHHLFPARSDANSSRGNAPFAEIDDFAADTWWCPTGREDTLPATDLALCSKRSSTAFEPRADHKGNAARAMFYFYTMYGTQADAIDASFWSQQEATLRTWHAEDPIDAAEQARSTGIAAVQSGKENPFVLDPTLVDRIAFGDEPQGSNTFAGVLISEVVDGTNPNGTPKYVEIYNAHATETYNLGTLALRRYANGGTSPASVTLTSASLAPGQTWVVAGSSFDSAWGGLFLTAAPNQTSGIVTGNGDDVYELFDLGEQVTLDVYGEIGVDGSGEAWEYTDRYATRNSTVNTGNGGLFAMSEWTLTPFSNTSVTPGAHTTDIPLPVEWVALEGQVDERRVWLRWTTGSEQDNVGFEIEVYDQTWVPIGFVAGQGTATIQKTYQFGWTAAFAGTYQFRIKQIDRDGQASYSRIVEVHVPPFTPSLLAVYPNPATTALTVRLEAPFSAPHQLALYDLLGRRVLVQNITPLQPEQVDVAGLSRGVYLLRVGEHVKKVILH